MTKRTYIKCGKLYNGIDDELKEGFAILTENDRIAEVGQEMEIPESAEVVDLSDATVTPGMIDAHMHMDYFHWQTIREDTFHLSNDMKTIAMLRCAQKTLSRGFTTVRHIGSIMSTNYNSIDVREAINTGYMHGSRLVIAPQTLSTAGSHGDFSQTFSRNPELCNLMQQTFPCLGAGKDFFTNAVREQVKYGADFIKIMATGGFFTPNDTPIQQQLSDDELQAIITTAKELGVTVTAHVYAPALMQKLVRFGIDGLEHGALMDEETAALIEEKDVYVVPTFCPYDEAVHYDAEKIALKPKEFREKLELYKDALIAGREQIRKSSITLGYGTDFVANHNNYESGYEYDAWLRSGMDPFRALKAATSTNARILQMEDKIGTLEKGKLADISAWKRDLLTDPHALLDCCFVMKDGTVYDTEPCEDEEYRN